ncbi:hypothetical protein Bpfe_007587 [Biomphalaria pfeifferi]|uniref:Uncharacterized protein n=1 Tax=Biomphalaria pfeifferi TaxID=112525 RepID=A0AAD8FFA4_BIOPF|nr:hypothetical protein Bpfe_007587 [Biomphalaria pfeifferi]
MLSKTAHIALSAHKAYGTRILTVHQRMTSKTTSTTPCLLSYKTDQKKKNILFIMGDFTAKIGSVNSQQRIRDHGTVWD